ncbi:MAG: UDP-N-acetylglucosamine 1-carboxyvinyltransferase [Bacilli bacterium]|nr:UDP-N-acetylglucosamine 1-carboxyvinyltransferase [Bacilli bacterium]MDY4053107.1 UDP-N-acetylglucosamine 1-carboxyvinyltransferase [Bacilli bacterium]
MNIIVKKCSNIEGKIEISGSKNACLPIIGAALLTNEKVTITNVPLISDVVSFIRILDNINVNSNYDYNNRKLEISTSKIRKKIESPYINKFRASYYIIPSLLHRLKEFTFDYPGGCNFGSRPIDIHLDFFRNIGVEVIEGTKMQFKVKKLCPVNYTFSTISVGATINAIMTCCKIIGKSKLKNVSIEPEVMDVINMLNLMGAKITVLNERIIEIDGVKKLNGITYEVMPDRIEFGSYALLSLVFPKSTIKIMNLNLEYIKNILDVIIQLGGTYEVVSNYIEIKSPININPINIQTGPYPLFPTDLQPILSTVLLKATSKSEIKETIYINRNSHIVELKKAEANITMEKGNIIIYPSILNTESLRAYDLRCGFAMIVAAILCNKKCIIYDVDYILRGYENIIEKLKSINIECEIERE